MYQDKLKLWTRDPATQKKYPEVSVREFFMLKDFAAWLDTERGLTTDAPKMTVGDSDPVSEHPTNDACPTCNGTDWVLHSHPNRCPTCAPEIGQEITVTPEWAG